MKVYRRIEITAFRRRVTISSGPLSDGPPADITLRNDLTDEVIDARSDEGRQILLDAVAILQEQLAEPEIGESKCSANM